MNAIGLAAMLMVCHMIGDYSHLSTDNMLAAKKNGYPLAPIAAHAAVHGALMAPFIGYCSSNVILFLSLIIIEIGTHYAIDVTKGWLNVLFPSLANPANRMHWHVFGIDQLLHTLVVLLIAYLATK